MRKLLRRHRIIILFALANMVALAFLGWAIKPYPALAQPSDLTLVYHGRATAAASAADYSYSGNSDQVRGLVITNLSTNQAHVSVTGTASNVGTGSITLPGTIGFSVFIPLGNANQTLSLIRDTAASGNATLMVWELAR